MHCKGVWKTLLLFFANFAIFIHPNWFYEFLHVFIGYNNRSFVLGNVFYSLPLNSNILYIFKGYRYRHL